LNNCIVLTQYFHFNELKILSNQVTSFFKLNQQYFFTASDQIHHMLGSLF